MSRNTALKEFQMNNEILSLFTERRSIRKFTDENIELTDLKTVLEAGRWSPSGLNNQPYRFITIDNEDPRKCLLEKCTHNSNIVRGCNILIGVFLEKSAMYNAFKDHQGSGACIQNMLLALHGLGLGGVWLGEIVNQSDQVMAVLNLNPEEFEFMGMIAAGKPAQNGSSTRRDLADLMLEPLAG